MPCDRVIARCTTIAVVCYAPRVYYLLPRICTYIRMCMYVCISADAHRAVCTAGLSHATKRFVSVHLSRSSSAPSTPPASNCVGNSIAAKLSRHYAQIVPRASALVNRELTRVSSISIEGPANFRSRLRPCPRFSMFTVHIIVNVISKN